MILTKKRAVNNNIRVIQKLISNKYTVKFTGLETQTKNLFRATVQLLKFYSDAASLAVAFSESL